MVHNLSTPSSAKVTFALLLGAFGILLALFFSWWASQGYHRFKTRNMPGFLDLQEAEQELELIVHGGVTFLFLVGGIVSLFFTERISQLLLGLGVLLTFILYTRITLIFLTHKD